MHINRVKKKQNSVDGSVVMFSHMSVCLAWGGVGNIICIMG